MIAFSNYLFYLYFFSLKNMARFKLLQFGQIVMASLAISPVFWGCWEIVLEGKHLRLFEEIWFVGNSRQRTAGSGQQATGHGISIKLFRNY